MFPTIRIDWRVLGLILGGVVCFVLGLCGRGCLPPAIGADVYGNRIKTGADGEVQRLQWLLDKVQAEQGVSVKTDEHGWVRAQFAGEFIYINANGDGIHNKERLVLHSLCGNRAVLRLVNERDLPPDDPSSPDFWR